MSNKIIIILGVVMPASAVAMFCPWSSKVINQGASYAQVEKQCGAPARIEKIVPPIKQTWTYILSKRDPEVSKVMKPWTPAFPYLKLHPNNVVVHFSDSRVDALQRFNQPVTKAACKNGLVRLGDDMVTVEQLCGTPTKQVKEAQKPQPEIQHWYYGTGGLPSKVLIFKGGILQ